MNDILYHIGKALAHAWLLWSQARWTQDYNWAMGVDVGKDAVVRVTVEVVEKAPYLLNDYGILGKTIEPVVEKRLEEVTA